MLTVCGRIVARTFITMLHLKLDHMAKDGALSGDEVGLDWLHIVVENLLQR